MISKVSAVIIMNNVVSMAAKDLICRGLWDN